ncbi:MAG: ABC-F family ATP-binding cassette domain-containing protein [Polyangiaceae bacterium]|nr:ABC-F family ATP-binding cassette domain-containing protein [Polyangiaceae bacterium]
MAVLQLHGIGVAWSASVPVLEDVSLVLDRGFYGLVGANGAGKTTLLAVLAGELAPHEGSVAVQPRDAVIAYCPQRVDAKNADVEALARRDDGLASELRGRLALDPAGLERWPTLSPGERKRWQIAAALAREPDVLLLDEPTNHLDADARRRLLGALRRFSGVGVVVSHDRTVLDALTSSTLRIHRRAVTPYPGSYSEALPLWQRERAAEEQAHAGARDRVRQAEAHLDAARRAQAGATAGKSTRARMKDKNDSDARGIIATTKASWAESRAGRVVGTARGELDRARQAVPEIERDATLGSKIFAKFERAPNQVLFHLDRDELRAGDHIVLRDVRVTIGRDDRVRIEGPNGAGKTTLLEALVAALPRRDRILYLPQELEAADVTALVERISSIDNETRGRLLSIFAALGSDPDRVARGGREGFSPGEARKLVLAEALARQVWALVLDEPTNHMDLPSVERLEAALASYPGCVLLVTHDDVFANKIVNRSVVIESGSIQ